mmetsp:Transcript_139766/g.447022  ORF Transcript_139766/g.447022 Transcript_139766/m.447022 type:complete len:256 (-) Transcript_139766:31-798(-)
MQRGVSREFALAMAVERKSHQRCDPGAVPELNKAVSERHHQLVRKIHRGHVDRSSVPKVDVAEVRVGKLWARRPRKRRGHQGFQFVECLLSKLHPLRDFLDALGTAQFTSKSSFQHQSPCATTQVVEASVGTPFEKIQEPPKARERNLSIDLRRVDVVAAMQRLILVHDKGLFQQAIGIGATRGLLELARHSSGGSSVALEQAGTFAPSVHITFVLLAKGTADHCHRQYREQPCAEPHSQAARRRLQGLDSLLAH